VALQQILFSAERDDTARAGVHAMIVRSLKKAFPLPKDDADDRFRELLEALSRRTQAGSGNRLA
jgi:hypothetical protein